MFAFAALTCFTLLDPKSNIFSKGRPLKDRADSFDCGLAPGMSSFCAIVEIKHDLLSSVSHLAYNEAAFIP